ncbi:MAG: hypothetical protein ACRC5C_10515 [Bacilli bacterium]
MKKILMAALAIFLSSIVFFVFTVSDVDNTEPVMESKQTDDARDLEIRNRISDHLYNLKITFNAAMRNARTIADVEELESIRNDANSALEVVSTGDAPTWVYNKVEEVNLLIQEAISEQDLSKLEKAREILDKLMK